MIKGGEIPTESFKPLYKELYSDKVKVYIESIKPYGPPINGAYLRPFFPQVGREYEKQKIKLLFVGKATDGWVLPADEYDESKFFHDQDNGLANIKDQMVWVEEASKNRGHEAHSHAKSHFWRFIKSITQEAHNVIDGYSNYIAWTNLYKLSLERGNPPQALKTAQFDACVRILREEIKLFEPTHIVFLTTRWEHPFLVKLGLNEYGDEICSELPLWIQKDAQGRYYIQTVHPERKPKDIISRLKSEIIKLIKKSKQH